MRHYNITYIMALMVNNQAGLTGMDECVSRPGPSITQI